ncbi:MAG TPA: TIGR02757 family protein [Bacteroidetes bacterium]|nr:TIGR02757 family protein [Bacteroidota bacterium]
MNYTKLKIYLEDIYSKYKHKHSSIDPVWILHNCKSDSDREVLGLIVSCYSYGNIDLINRFINKFIEISGMGVTEFIKNFDASKDKKYFKEMNYRFNNSEDFVLLLLNIKSVLEKKKSLSVLIKELADKNLSVINIISDFVDELKFIKSKKQKNFDYLLPHPGKGSTCKRMNLYFRWMVREDEIDLGVWKKFINKSELIMPVDTHIYKVSQELKMIKRKSCDMKYALELTDFLKSFDPTDPVRFDFALCHIKVK